MKKKDTLPHFEPDTFYSRWKTFWWLDKHGEWEIGWERGRWFWGCGWDYYDGPIWYLWLGPFHYTGHCG